MPEASVVELTKSEVKKARKLAANYASTKWKGSSYKKGLINSPEDPHRAERTGILGEMAVAKLFGCKINSQILEHGDSGVDFKFPFGNIDVKTARSSYKRLLVKCTTDDGKTPVELRSDYYIAAKILCEDENSAIIYVYGFMSKRKLNKLDPVRAIKGRHLNKEVRYDELDDIKKLIKKLKVKK